MRKIDSRITKIELFFEKEKKTTQLDVTCHGSSAPSSSIFFFSLSFSEGEREK